MTYWPIRPSSGVCAHCNHTFTYKISEKFTMYIHVWMLAGDSILSLMVQSGRMQSQRLSTLKFTPCGNTDLIQF